MKKIFKLALCLWVCGMIVGATSAQNAGDKEKKPAQPPKVAEQAKPCTPEVTATAANLQIEISLSVVSFDKKDLEDVARKSPGASVQAADVLALWRAGKGRLVTTVTGRTANSEQFTIKDIVELRYPQAYEAYPIPASHGTNGASTVAGPSNIPLIPADYQTREIGMIFVCTPYWDGESKVIQLTMTPENSAKIDAETATYKFVTPNLTNTHYFSQPTVQNKTIQIKTACADGETVVYSSDILNQGYKEMSYLLITPHLLRP
jgi:hypothetical protein